MKSKIIGVWLAVLAPLLASQFALSLPAGQAVYSNLLLVTPNTFGTPTLNTEKLEELADEEFLLTYAIRQPASARAINSSHSAALIGTNHRYADIMGYIPLDGGFFTEAAMDSKSRHVTLNETAAFRMFGGHRITGGVLKINGEAWIISGVIQDNDTENINLYVPASVTGGHADSVMALMDETYTGVYIKNALKSVGIHENNYDFINLSKSAGMFYERFSVAWKAALSVIILHLTVIASKALMYRLRFLRGKTRELYFRELLVRYRVDFLKAAGCLLAFLGGISAMLALSLQILGVCLTWRELTPVTGELTAGAFGSKLVWLQNYQTFGLVLFIICLCVILSGLIPVIMGHAGQSGKQ